MFQPETISVSYEDKRVFTDCHEYQKF